MRIIWFPDTACRGIAAFSRRITTKEKPGTVSGRPGFSSLALCLIDRFVEGLFPLFNDYIPPFQKPIPLRFHQWRQFFIVHRDAALLDQPAGFPREGANPVSTSSSITLTAPSANTSDGISVEGILSLTFTGRKQGAGGFLGLVGLFPAVDQTGHLPGQPFLDLVDGTSLRLLQLTDFVHGQEGEQLQALCHIGVADITPVLVEIIGRHLFRIQPNRSLFRFSHFLPSELVSREKVIP